MIMSGVDDGSLLKCSSANGDGQKLDDGWMVSVGRHDSNDVCLNNDTFVSRQHAKIYWQDGGWWLEDCESTNGTFIEMPSEDLHVESIVPLQVGQLFRIGRTWLRVEPPTIEIE
jgi:pSer/pThr/pTyr-binding forkhead associated (FHA) protein